MKLKLFIFSILIGCALKAGAQTFTLTGRVTDQDMTPIEFASVSVVKQGAFTMTSLKGDFSLTLHSADSVIVKFSMIGYKTKTRVLRNPRGKQTLQIVLHTDDTTLDEVTVTEMKRQTGQTQELKKEDIKTAPSVTGNAVEEMIQSQAGVSTHSELSSQYNVRGGSFDENSVYINNMEIFRPFLVRSGQQEGLSIICPDMVEKIGFSTGGFESKYGDKMSSVLDITYKRLEPKESKKRITEGNVAVSLLGAGAYLGLANKKVSWLNSLRYKTNRYLLGSLETKGEYDPNFLEYQTYLSYIPNKRWQIDFIGNISENHYNFKPKDRETAFGTQENVKSFRVYYDGHEKDLFRTLSGSLSITRNFTEKTKLTLSGSMFYTNEQEKFDIQGQYWLTQTETSENLGVGTYFEHTRDYLKANVQSAKLMLTHKTQRHNIETGITLKHECIRENTQEYEMRDSAGYSIPHTGQDLHMIYTLRAKNELKANRTESYIQDTWKFSNASETTFYTLNYGLRMSHWTFNRETIVSPRISLSIVPAFDQDMTIRFATGLYYQAPFYKELRDTFVVDGTTHAQLNNKIKSQRSLHIIAGMDKRFNINAQKFKFTAEAYYKAMGNLIPYSVNNLKVTYYGGNVCSGHAVGLDLKLFGEFVPGTDSWISFSLMDAKMKLNGQNIPMPTDQRYGINLFFTDYFPGTQKWKMNLKLAFADGLPFSAPHREMISAPFRAPAYKRADIGMSYRLLDNEKYTKKNTFKNIWLGVDCLNLFGINNVNSYYWITDVTNQQYAVPNYLTGRQINGRVMVEF